MNAEIRAAVVQDWGRPGQQEGGVRSKASWRPKRGVRRAKVSWKERLDGCVQ